MPTNREIELTLLQRIRDIDHDIERLRMKQKGVEESLMVVRGETEIVTDRLCDPLGRSVSMVETSPRSGSSGSRRNG